MFARSPEAQAKVTAAGFRAGTSSDELALPAKGTVTATLDQWEGIRKRARVLLLFDVSDSMGDLSDPRDTNSPSKLAVAKGDLLNALPEFAPDDEVGLRIFTTGLPGGRSSDWADVVPIGRFDRQRAALTNAIRAADAPQGIAALHRDTCDAYDAMATKNDPKRINGVVLLTDGYNEDERNTDLKALLARHARADAYVHHLVLLRRRPRDAAKDRAGDERALLRCDRHRTACADLRVGPLELLDGFAVDVGFDEDQRRVRLGGADVDFERVDRGGELGHCERSVDLDLRGDDDLLGAELLGTEMDAAADVRVRLDRGADLGDDLRRPPRR